MTNFGDSLPVSAVAAFDAQLLALFDEKVGDSTLDHRLAPEEPWSPDMPPDLIASFLGQGRSSSVTATPRSLQDFDNRVFCGLQLRLPASDGRATGSAAGRVTSPLAAQASRAPVLQVDQASPSIARRCQRPRRAAACLRGGAFAEDSPESSSEEPTSGQGTTGQTAVTEGNSSLQPGVSPSKTSKRKDIDFDAIEDLAERRKQKRLAKNRATAAVSRERKKLQLQRLESRVKADAEEINRLRYMIRVRDEAITRLKTELGSVSRGSLLGATATLDDSAALTGSHCGSVPHLRPTDPGPSPPPQPQGPGPPAHHLWPPFPPPPPPFPRPPPPPPRPPGLPSGHGFPRADGSVGEPAAAVAAMGALPAAYPYYPYPQHVAVPHDPPPPSQEPQLMEYRPPPAPLGDSLATWGPSILGQEQPGWPGFAAPGLFPPMRFSLPPPLWNPPYRPLQQELDADGNTYRQVQPTSHACSGFPAASSEFSGTEPSWHPRR